MTLWLTLTLTLKLTLTHVALHFHAPKTRCSVEHTTREFRFSRAVSGLLESVFVF